MISYRIICLYYFQKKKKNKKDLRQEQQKHSGQNQKQFSYDAYFLFKDKGKVMLHW